MGILFRSIVPLNWPIGLSSVTINLIYTILLKLFTFNFNTNTKIYEQIYNILDKKEEILNKTSDIKLIEYRHDPKLIIDDILKQTIFIKD